LLPGLGLEGRQDSRGRRWVMLGMGAKGTGI